MRHSNGSKSSRDNWRTLCLGFPVELVNFLDHLAWEMLETSSCRHKLDRMSLLRALVRVLKESDFKIGGAENEDAIVEAVLRQIEERRGKNPKGRK